MPTVREGSWIVRIPSGSVQGEIPAKVVSQIFVGKKAWWNASELSSLPEYDEAPPPEVRARMLKLLDKQ